MNPLREAAQQALEALEKTHTQPGCEQWQAERKASVALRAALAQEESGPEPSVAQLNAILDGLGVVAHGRQSAREFLRVWIRDWTMHKVALALAQQEQEPVARVIDDETPEGSTEWIPYSGRQVPVKTGDLLYTAPPRREWQSLSEGEVASCWAKGFEACKDQTVGDLRMHIARDIEAALKEKNQ
jgi:hypothetical protein